MKIGIVTKGLAPYRLDFYEELAKAKDFEVCVLVPSLDSPDHPWVSQLNGRTLDILVLEGKGYEGGWGKVLKMFGFGGNKSAGWSPSLWRHLNESRYSLLLVHEASPYCWTALVWGKLHQVPVYMSSDIGRESPSYSCGRGTRIVHALASYFIKGRLANTEVARMTYGLSRDLIFVPHASSPKTVSLSQKEPNCSSRAEVVILFVGQLSKRKGVDLLLSSLQYVETKTPFKLRLVGEQKDDCGLTSEIEKASRFCQIEVVGFCEGEDLWKEYHSADFFVMPTRYDTYGVVIHEAAYFGLPLVVSTGAGAASVLVDDGNNGFTYEPENIHELAKLMSALIDDPEKRNKMGSNSVRIAEEFGVAKNAEKVRDFFLRNE